MRNSLRKSIFKFLTVASAEWDSAIVEENVSSSGEPEVMYVVTPLKPLEHSTKVFEVLDW